MNSKFFLRLNSRSNINIARVVIVSLITVITSLTVVSYFAPTVLAQDLGPCTTEYGGRSMMCQYGERGQVVSVIGPIPRNSTNSKILDNFETGTTESIETKTQSAEKSTFNTLNNMMSSVIVQIFGSRDIDEALSDQMGTTVTNGGAIPSLANSIGYMYGNPPATTEQYIAYLMNSSGIQIASPVYAQSGGLGFSSLLPILDTWIIFRNVAYLFFVVIFLVIGFMIMFRQKIGSQTVVTAQQALPQIIISLLAVTFSFAIAGLLIDGMYIFMELLIVLFPKVDSQTAITLKNGDIFQVGFYIFSKGVTDTAGTVNATILDLLTWNNLIENIVAGATSILATLIISIAILISLFRLFFNILMTYVSIILSIITAPLALMLGAIPGRSYFSAWIKGLVGNLSVFPVLLSLLLIYESLTNASAQSFSTGGFSPPYLISGTLNSDTINGVIGLGLIMILPTILEKAKEAFGAKGNGLFDQFSGALKDAVTSGWRGGELVPGIGVTNTGNFGFSGSGITKFAYNQSKNRAKDWSINRQLRKTEAPKELAPELRKKAQRQAQTGVNRTRGTGM
jgi:hypothetical protein